MPSSRNAVSHGIHTSVVVLSNENDAECRRVEAEHLALWQPAGPLERLAALPEKRAYKEAQTLARQQNAQILQNETPPEKAA